MEETVGSWLNPVAEGLPAWLRPWLDAHMLFALVVVVVLGVLAVVSSRNLTLVPRSKVQSVGEWVYEGLQGLSRGILGHEGERYTWVIGGFFLYIFALNLLGLVPGFLSPSTRLNTTIALALCAITLAQIIGMRHNGVRYWLRFTGKIWKLRLPNPLKIVEELVKPLSLSIRLFGNIFGDDMAVLQFAALGAGGLAVIFGPEAISAGLALKIGGGLGALLGVGITSVMLGFALLVAFIQAFVFSLLTGAYILFAIEME